MDREKWVQVCRVLFSGDAIYWTNFQRSTLFRTALDVEGYHEKVWDEIYARASKSRWWDW